MSSHLAFPLAEFYDALVAKNLREKLQPFIAQFRKKNIYIIYECINRLIQILTNKSELPIMKFNSLMAVRYFFDTCEYPAIIFIQIFLLPIVYEIALQKYLKRSEEGIQLYFVDRGTQNTKQIRRLGLNYVQLANQFIFNSAKVKPYRLVQNRQLKEESNFVRTVKVLNNKGIQEQQKCIFYIPSYALQQRKKYLKKLKHFSPEPYISFVISEYLEEINLNKKCDLDLKKLLMFGDPYLTSTIVEIIEEELSNMKSNFVNKKKYLNLLGDLIRSGEIQSIYLINTASFLQDIAEEIGKVKGQVNQRGEYIYPKIQASKQQKKEFFLQFLRVIEIWAHCIPETEEGQQSDVAAIYQGLKKKNFVFPKNVILKKIKQQMQQNLVLNQARNDMLLRIIDEDDKSSRNQGSYVSAKGEFKFHFPDYKQTASFLQLDDLQGKVFQAKKRIAKLFVKKSQLQDNMNHLQQFKSNWDEDLQKLDIQDEDPHELNMLLDEGDICCEQFKLVAPIYDSYKKGKMDYDTFLKRIQFLENIDQTDLNKSSAKVTQKSHINSQKLNASMSKSVRKHIEEEFLAQYGHNYNRDNILLESRKLQTFNNSKNPNQFKPTPQNISIEKIPEVALQQKASNQSKKNSQKRISQKDSQRQLKKTAEKLSNIKSNKSKEHKRSQIQQFHSQSDSKSSMKQPSQRKNAPNQSAESQIKSKQSKGSFMNNFMNKQIPQYLPVKQNENMFSNPLRAQKGQVKDNKEDSQISESSSQQQSNIKKKIQAQSASSKKSPESKRINFKTEQIKQRTLQPQIYPQKANQHLKNFQTAEKEKQQLEENHFYNDQDDYQSQKQSQRKRKSIIKYSVISKSSYHSQPTEPKIMDSNLHQCGSVMNEYQIQNNQNQGITVKKSSIKRTQHSGMKNSSHKLQNSKSPLIVQAVSPFKKKNQPSSKDLKIKETYTKEYEFIKSNKKQSKQSLDENYAYDNAFRRNQMIESSRNQSEVSSQSQSVIQKRNKKRQQKQGAHNEARLYAEADLQYFNQAQSQNPNKFGVSRKEISKAKNVILFESSHHPSSKLNQVNQQYDIKQSKVDRYFDKIGQFGKNTERFISPKGKSSGIKLMSKNDFKQFDSLYKNQYGNGGDSCFQNNMRYEEVTSEYKPLQKLINSKNVKKDNKFQQSNNQALAKCQRNNEVQNVDYLPVSMEEIDQDIQKFKSRPKRHKDPQISQIHEPQNLPMLYSYYSDKSIHSKMTDSHTPKGNISSNYSDFKSCYFNMDKEVLPLDLKKSKAVSNSFSMDKARNFIDFRVCNSKTPSRVNTVVDAINQKNAKNSILMYKLEREKTRLVQNLQNKIKSLQMNGKLMKTKLAVKDQSIRQNMNGFTSERNAYSPQVKTSRQSSNNNNSLSINTYENNRKVGGGQLKNNVQKTIIENSQYDIDQKISNIKCKLINSKQHSKFFPFTKDSGKKSLYRKKGVLIKNDEIQIGYMISKKDKHAIVNVFITPNVASIKNVIVDVQCDSNLSSKIKQSKIDSIQAKKQQIVVCSFTAQNIPFKLPIMNIKFDQNRSYKANTYSLVLPCTMIAFCETFQPLKSLQPSQKAQLLGTQMFKCSKKLSKPEKLKQIFPEFKIEATKKQKIIKLQGQIKYQYNTLNITMQLNTLGYLNIKGYRSQEQQSSSNKFLQFLLVTLKYLLEEVDQ